MKLFIDFLSENKALKGHNNRILKSDNVAEEGLAMFIPSLKTRSNLEIKGPCLFIW
jgi:hypothetical protein